MPLVAADDFASLPKEPVARWLQLRDLVEKRLDSFADINNGGNDRVDLLAYVQILTAAADELEVGSLAEVSPANIHEEIDSFRASVAGLATRLSLRIDHENGVNYVALERPTRKKILVEVENLRFFVQRSDLSDELKKAALAQLDQLQILIIAPKTDIARVGILLTGIGAFIFASTSFLADAPSALGTISALIGVDRMEQEQEQKLIEGVKSKLQIQDLRDIPSDGSTDDTPY